MISGITWTHIQSVWNHSGSSEGPYSTKPVTGQELFFAVSYNKPALAPKLETYIALFMFLEFRQVSTILGISTQLNMFRSNNSGSIRLNNLLTLYDPRFFMPRYHILKLANYVRDFKYCQTCTYIYILQNTTIFP